MSIALHYSFRQIDPESPYDRENIPEDLVEQVYLKFCDLTGFPEWLLGLQNLTHINIACNAIDQLPPTIELLPNLNYLDASANKIAVLPESLFQLTKLSYLDVSRNLIDNIPAGDTRDFAKKMWIKAERFFLLCSRRESRESRVPQLRWKSYHGGAERVGKVRKYFSSVVRRLLAAVPSAEHTADDAKSRKCELSGV